ncbi:hypothetical protein [Massilia rhizosphaerae]|uniref:hypothetical protein n=1 Tax=Massilia rhizosphaerae TaxID=2784389 RepID=UPI0018DC871D|nr:hypothetical protein [Massilia rhizosphaerae]
MSAPLRQSLPFTPFPSARASLKPGALYAIDGDDGFIYYGQVTPEKSIGFFRLRSEVVSIPDALSAAVMSRFLVGHPSIGRAVRSGKWLSIGTHPIHTALCDQAAMVQWPVGTTEVTIWKGGVTIGTTQVHDPSIQDLEIIAAYDAEAHVPERLRVDYNGNGDAWSVGGSIRRERVKKQALARKFPDAPWHQLPSDWVPVEE